MRRPSGSGERGAGLVTSTSHAPASRSRGQTCSRCGSDLNGRFCHECGAEIFGARLNPHGAAGRVASAFSWRISRFSTTLLDLTVKPAQVAWVYLSGHRDRYLHPVPYLVFALLAERLAYVCLLGFAAWLGRPGAALLIQPGFWNRLPQVVAVLVVAVIWRVFFRRSGFNLFEMSAIALYAYAHFVVLWTAFALVMGVLPIQGMSFVRWGVVLQAVLGYAVAVHTGGGIFRENPVMVAFKILVAAAIPFEILAALDSILSHG
jgi:hypothetical protein